MVRHARRLARGDPRGADGPVHVPRSAAAPLGAGSVSDGGRACVARAGAGGSPGAGRPRVALRAWSIHLVCRVRRRLRPSGAEPAGRLDAGGGDRRHAGVPRRGARRLARGRARAVHGRRPRAGAGAGHDSQRGGRGRLVRRRLRLEDSASTSATTPRRTARIIPVPGITSNIQGRQEDARRVAEAAAGRKLDEGEVSAYFYGLGRIVDSAAPGRCRHALRAQAVLRLQRGPCLAELQLSLLRLRRGHAARRPVRRSLVAAAARTVGLASRDSSRARLGPPKPSEGGVRVPDLAVVRAAVCGLGRGLLRDGAVPSSAPRPAVRRSRSTRSIGSSSADRRPPGLRRSRRRKHKSRSGIPEQFCGIARLPRSLGGSHRLVALLVLARVRQSADERGRRAIGGADAHGGSDGGAGALR